MANLEISSNGKAQKGRTTKSAPRVDLTAMVDLMFLLTTFFMLTTSLTDLKAADISKPIKSDIESPYPASRTMTILLGKNAQAAYYMGETENANLNYSKVSLIAEQVLINKSAVAKLHQNNPSKYLIVIIKPTKTATFKDFVDVIDEMKITGIKSYAIEDENISPKEKIYMETNGL
ncbi:ExbD/TolR family protein [Pedobacter jejuensis]|nr:biopolymer transporter ExbD [Pedobacter jejuensis]